MSGLLVIGGGPALVEDGGRQGLQHQGVPQGGALVPELLAAANRALGNLPDAPALECHGSLLLEARRELRLSVDGELHSLAAGERLRLSPAAARVTYLALEGGLDVPLVLGGRGTLLCAALGGHEGRLLRAGDLLLPRRPGREGAGGAGAPSRDEAGGEGARRWPRRDGPGGEGAPRERADVPASGAGPLLDPAAPIRVVPGPDGERFPAEALALLLGAQFRAGRGDRTGLRLTGPALPRLDGDAAISGPMAPGALQVTGSGEAIVLGPDHPTTGGYPLLATVIRADLGPLLARRPGAGVRFAAIGVEEARALFRAHAALRLAGATGRPAPR